MNTFRCCLAVCLLLVVPVSTECFGQQNDSWRQFLGPDAASAVDHDRLPTTWNEMQGFVWKSMIQGLGWSSPVVDQNQIFLTAGLETGDQVRLVLQCYDWQTGQLNFEQEIFTHAASSPAIHKKNSHASPTPIIDGDRVFVHFGHQGTACLSRSGEVLWKNQQHRYSPVHGNGSTPLLHDGRLIITCDGGDLAYTLCLDAQTGRELWRTPRGIEADRTFSFCTPVVIEVDGQPQILSVGAHLIQSLDPRDGTVLWYARFEGFSVIPRPLYHHGLVVLSTGYERPETLAFDPTGTGDVTETHLRWRATRGAPNTPSMLAYGDAILQLSDNGILSALDTRSGRELWRKRLGGTYSATPLLAKHRLYALSEDGETTILELFEATEPKELARNRVEGRAFASFAVVGNNLLLRTERELMRIGNP